MPFSIRISTIYFLCLFLIGCGGNTRTELSEAQNVDATVAALADAAYDEESFQEQFVSGSTPEDREAYASCVFEVEGEPSVSGDEATVEVQVTTGYSADNSDRGGDNAEGERETRNVTWTLAKQSGEWKIKDAPLE